MADQPAVTTRRSIPNTLRVVALVLGAAVLLLFLWTARSLVLTTFLAVIAGLAVSRATDWLQKRHIPRGVGAPLVILAVIGAVGGVVAAIAPTVREQARDLTTQVPKAFKQIEEWIGISPQAALGGGQGQGEGAAQQGGGQGQGEGAAQRGGGQGQSEGAAQQGGGQAGGPGAPAQQRGGGGGGSPSPALGEQAQQAGRFVLPAISGTFEAIAGVLILIFLAIYIAVSPKTYYEGIMHLVPHSKRDRAEEVLGDLGATLRGWLIARLIAMVVIGIVTGAGLALIGVRGALALGLLAGLLELIPFYGPIIAAIPALGIAIVESPQQALYVLILYVVIQQFEGNVLTPIILKERLEIPPVLTIVAVTAFGLVFGVLGMLAAEPFVAAMLLVVRKLYVRDVIGDDVEEDDDEKDAD